MNKSTPPTTGKADARERLIAAAIRVFERDGLRGATTREIAREAEVNEVTLFRHFQNKGGLLAAVMEHKMQIHMELLETDSIWTGDLTRDLREYGKALYRSLGESEAFIRMLVGEAKRQPDYSRQMMIDAAKPTCERFANHLKQAVSEGRMRADLNPRIVVDAFTDMLLFGMLRETAQWMPYYDAESYVQTCVSVFIAGLAAPKTKQTSKHGDSPSSDQSKTSPKR
jgi:AcrR family transcriptional regulator